MRANAARWPWTRPLLLLLLVVELVAASFALRSEHFLAEPAADALARLGARFGGRFEYSTIEPEGLTGVRLEGVAFYLAGRATPAATLNAVRIYPDLLALARGDIAFQHVAIDRADVMADEQLLQRLRVEHTSSAASAVRGTQFNEISIDYVDVHLRDDRLPSGRLDFGLEHLVATRDGGLQIRSRIRAIDRLLGELDVRFGAEPLLRVDVAPDFAWEQWLTLGVPVHQLRLESIRFDGRELALEGVLARGITTPAAAMGWRIDVARADRVRVELDGPRVAIEGASLRFGSKARMADIPIRRIALSPPTDLSLELGDEDGYAHVTLDTQRTAVTLEAHRYDLAPWAPLMADNLPLRLDSGRFSGSLDLAWQAESNTLRARVDGGLEEGVALAPFLAERPLEAMAVGLQGEVAIDLDSQSLSWDRGRITLAGIPVTFTTRLDWSGNLPQLDVDAELYDVPAEQLRRGLPRGLAPRLDDLDLSGTISAQMRVRLDGQTPEASVLDVDLDLSRLAIDSFGAALPVASLAGSFRLDIVGEDGVVRTIGPATSSWVTLPEVSRYLTSALVSAEDGSFWTHDGFDWTAVQRSIELNVREGRIVRGGSTISQQVVRTLFLGHERTLGRKLEEAFLTWQLEQLVGKERILELYVNAVHWGPGIQGVVEAARTYFRRTPAQLTLSESAFLASILPNPDYFGLQYARNIVTPTRREKICNILRNMYNSAAIDERQYRRDCQAVEAGIVSIVPVPSWLVDDEIPRFDETPSLAGALDEMSALEGMASISLD